MRRITKKMLSAKRRIFLSACGDWVTNGAWALRLDSVHEGDLLRGNGLRAKFGALAGDEAGPSMDGLLRALPKATVQYHPLPWIWEKPGEIPRRVLSGGDGKMAFIDPQYFSLCDSSVLWGEPLDLERTVAYFYDSDADPTAVIGGMRPVPVRDMQLFAKLIQG